MPVTASPNQTGRGFGLVVPPENPTAEPEFSRLVGAELPMYTTRFPTTPGLSLSAMLHLYNEKLVTTVAGFGALPLDAAVIACTGSHYLLGPAGDRRVCAELTARQGYPVLSATQAILSVLAEHQVDRLAIVSPYAPWLTEASVSFWQSCGVTVTQLVVVAGDHDHNPYLVQPAQLAASINDADLPDDLPIVCTGTGMRTLDTLRTLQADAPDRLVLSSNLAAASWLTGRHPAELLADAPGQPASSSGSRGGSSR